MTPLESLDYLRASLAERLPQSDGWEHWVHQTKGRAIRFRSRRADFESEATCDLKPFAPALDAFLASYAFEVTGEFERTERIGDWVGADKQVNQLPSGPPQSQAAWLAELLNATRKGISIPIEDRLRPQ